ncbi:hypothetical protein COU37_03515 [Candidatus Micrarchaeota archaeon CG10_big_fil_rev_8_21_14_0_10_45_29]|nr:MAG: hypothetical protein COU37_03515 [Candidatus Micrarchaeota archaeon CG10_big_fil_rev_8_21_14_0_10_45_29]
MPTSKKFRQFKGFGQGQRTAVCKKDLNKFADKCINEFKLLFPKMKKKRWQKNHYSSLSKLEAEIKKTENELKQLIIHRHDLDLIYGSAVPAVEIKIVDLSEKLNRFKSEHNQKFDQIYTKLKKKEKAKKRKKELKTPPPDRLSVALANIGVPGVYHSLVLQFCREQLEKDARFSSLPFEVKVKTIEIAYFEAKPLLAYYETENSANSLQMQLQKISLGNYNKYFGPLKKQISDFKEKVSGKGLPVSMAQQLSSVLNLDYLFAQYMKMYPNKWVSSSEKGEKTTNKLEYDIMVEPIRKILVASNIKEVASQLLGEQRANELSGAGFLDSEKTS